MKKLLVVIGLPGSGKDTQIDSLAQRRQLKVIKVGDLVRQKAQTDADVAEDLKKGNLADDTMVNELIAEAISSSEPDGYIVSDGFPRDLDQAKWLEDYLNKNSVMLDKVIYLEVDDVVAMERLLKRGREDDTEKIIKHRVDVFHEQTDPVAEYFRPSGKLLKIDGNGTPEEVQEDIKEGLGW